MNHSRSHFSCQETTNERWREDGTLDRKYAEESIKAGVLQIIASQFVGKAPQQRAGESEMRNGIIQAIAAKAGRKKRKPVSPIIL